MSINHPLSDSASPAELATHAKIVEAGRKAFSVLAINSRLSSLRFTLFKTGESLAPILTGKLERIGLLSLLVFFIACGVVISICRLDNESRKQV
ncbi:MAG: hypothetical protein O2960_25240 [Verrucomicrobia bacterium]|nr:hypothetical protein [Verrucomicrobiota bacterium]